MIKRILILCIFCLCCASPNASSSDIYQLALPDGVVIEAEVVKDKAKGLQNRNYLCPECGMLFIFEAEGLHSFWMKDTLLSLTLVWMDKQGKVVHIVRAAEPCKYESDPRRECEVYIPGSKAKYVLELLPGADSSIKIGSELKILKPDKRE
ncbi:MAG: hypothetical protein GWM89_05135 [Candidatus Dadabacteria bacterium]|nr:DUF192 domain-containing protein [Candidatus Dadabacteria bacterium]NIV41595.1 hypothetical protein [Candidatus Dadabacteria bacterium]NIX15157.1 hypothetical protein [Candidatus Dadabacteria bacterium]NIY21802.1 hypothetical protein [Candidatus Dadabacteria bacterium]